MAWASISAHSLALIIGAAVIGLVSSGGDIVVPLFGEVYAWQLTFFVVGLPGILIALWVWTVREPERRGYMRKEIAEDGTETAVEVPVSEVFAYMRVNWRTILPLNICYALSAMMAYGVAAWIPTFFVRTYDWSYPQSRLGGTAGSSSSSAPRASSRAAGWVTCSPIGASATVA